MSLDVTGRYRYPHPDPEWLERVIEPVIDPERLIVDPHHHLWVEDGNHYLLSELVADLDDGHRIAATVFVQAHYGYRTELPPHLAPVGETEKVVAIAEAARAQGVGTRVAEAIVAHADLTRGTGVEEVLDAHERAAGGRLRGIRHGVSRDEHFPDGIVLRPAPARLLADPDYRTGLSVLASRGLVYDAMLYHAQLPELVHVADELPQLTIVLDHAGCMLGVGHYEGRERETFDAWRRDMAELAHRPNVVVKVGGFGMIIGGARWHEDDRPPSSARLASAWRSRVDACVDLFGADRCMFESNFPVDKAMYSYRTLWNAFKRIAASYDEDQRRALFAGTATRVYGLDPGCAPSEESRH